MVYSAKSDDTNTISQFTRKKTVTITTGGTSTPANYQVKLDITYESEMQADFDDIRFNTKSGDYIDYWIESHVASTSAVVWIELPNAITHPGSDIIFMFYGNSVLSDGENGDDTFLYYTESLPGYVGAQYSAGVNTALRFRAEFTATNQQFGYSTVTSNPRYLFQSLISNNPDIQYYNAVTGYVDIGAGDINGGYHIYDIMRNSTTDVKSRYDDGAINTHVIDNTGSIEIESYGTFNFDWGFVHAYITNEPTPSYGTPQHQRRTPRFIN